MVDFLLSAVQEDYLEAIYEDLRHSDATGIRVTDLAEKLGCRLPTVTRTVQHLTQMGLVIHPARGLVSLSRKGRQVAQNIFHRHRDVLEFLTKVLGLSKRSAERDTCKLEHGLSSETAERLHAFMEYFATLTEKEQDRLTDFRTGRQKRSPQFQHLPRGRVQGWRN